MKIALLIFVFIILVTTMISCTINGKQDTQDTPLSLPNPNGNHTPENIQLIDEVLLTSPESGYWYEWDKAGTYPANQDFEGSLCYISAQDWLLRSYDGGGDLIISRLNGAETKILDSGILGSINVYNGMIYYLKPDGVWKIKPDETENYRIVEYNANSIRDHLFIFDDSIYIIKEYEEYIECTDLEGKNQKILDVPDIPMGFYFFAEDYLYYGADSIDKDPLGDTWDIWRYNINTKSAEKLVSEIFGTLLVRDGMAYYVYDNLYRTNGEKTDTVISDESRWWNYNYNLYRNYLLYIKTEDEYGTYDIGALCAFNVETGQEYPLFDISESNMKIYVTENNVFLYSGCQQDPVYQITFVNDTAQLWKLNGLSKS